MPCYNHETWHDRILQDYAIQYTMHLIYPVLLTVIKQTLTCFKLQTLQQFLFSLNTTTYQPTTNLSYFRKFLHLSPSIFPGKHLSFPSLKNPTKWNILIKPIAHHTHTPPKTKSNNLHSPSPAKPKTTLWLYNFLQNSPSPSPHHTQYMQIQKSN